MNTDKNAVVKSNGEMIFVNLDTRKGYEISTKEPFIIRKKTTGENMCENDNGYCYLQFTFGQKEVLQAQNYCGAAHTKLK
jgi:hypothetical protein